MWSLNTHVPEAPTHPEKHSSTLQKQGHNSLQDDNLKFQAVEALWLTMGPNLSNTFGTRKRKLQNSHTFPPQEKPVCCPEWAGGGAYPSKN